MTDASLGSELSEDIASWTAKNLRTHIYPREFERFMHMLQNSKEASDADLLQMIPKPVLGKSVLHSDAGPAFIGLNKFVTFICIQLTHNLHSCRDIDLEGRTACAKHLETNVTSCSTEIKELSGDLLYGRCLSIHMACDTRDTLLSLVLISPTISQTTKAWFQKTFGSEEGMQTNTQAFRNFLYTCGYCADSRIELFFRNHKGTRVERCTLSLAHLFTLTRSHSAELKRGLLHETLDKHFTFVDVRMSKVSIDLQNLLRNDQFMDQDQPKAGDKLSTLHRWKEQVSECTLQCLRHLLL